MTPDQLQALKALIDGDPALSSMPMTSSACFEIAQIINTPTKPGIGPITVAKAMLWAANGPRVRIGAASTDAQQPEAIRASCLVFLDLIVSGADQQIDTQEAGIRSLFDGWLAVGLITQAEYDAVYGATGIAATLIPRSVVATGQLATSDDVREAREMP